jgi:predicted amidophosphoribosyltransferase
MFRRDRFREDLLFEQAAELMNIEERLLELDALLAAATVSKRHAPAAKCECGAPILWGSHFCGNCGRPVGDAPIAACPVCGHALPADAQFCAACGTPAEAMSGEAAAISADSGDARS